jgi:hypothetical protein
MRLIFEPSRLKLYISPCGSITKAMMGAAEGVGIDGPARADRDDYDRSIDADFPAVGFLESGERLFGHEHDDEGARLDAELKAE